MLMQNSDWRFCAENRKKLKFEEKAFKSQSCIDAWWDEVISLLEDPKVCFLFNLLLKTNAVWARYILLNRISSFICNISQKTVHPYCLKAVMIILHDEKNFGNHYNLKQIENTNGLFGQLIEHRSLSWNSLSKHRCVIFLTYQPNPFYYSINDETLTVGHFSQAKKDRWSNLWSWSAYYTLSLFLSSWIILFTKYKRIAKPLQNDPWSIVVLLLLVWKVLQEFIDECPSHARSAFILLR